MNSKGEAFVKGGCGCLALFVVFGLCCVMVGGYMRINLFGALALFGIGGVLGLVVNAVYDNGRRQGNDRYRRGDPPKPPIEDPWQDDPWNQDRP